MLRIELSALSAQELKRLLDMARARNQTALAQQLVAELGSRPMRAEDWAPVAMTYAPRPEYAPDVDVAPPRRNGLMAATAVVAAFVSAAVTWGLSVPPPQRAAPPEASRPAIVLASLAPVGPPVGFSEAPPLEPETVEVEAQPAQLARVTPTPARIRNPCFDLPTAAERLVCGYPGLAAQDRQLRAAYERAVAAGVERRELDRTQALWRSGSENLSDRAQLSDRYARRIRELEVAAATAPPPPPPPDEPPF